MQKVKIKKNDEVLVIAGRDKGARGKVLKVFPTSNRAIVERINMVKRHTRPNPNRGVQGGVLEREAPIELSNLMVVCPDCGKPTRIGRKRLADGKAARVCKRCEATLS
jgi:large subunit ribosomal protein L24